MQFYISYFYQVRFFNKNCIPISTAAWDPKWFHAFQGSAHTFFDKNGVLNGVRSSLLQLPTSWWNKLNQQCEKNCPYKPFECEFMEAYLNYLRTLDFKTITNNMKAYGTLYAKENNLKEEDIKIILLVHEAPSRNCAERPCLRKWFEENGILLPEWTK